MFWTFVATLDFANFPGMISRTREKHTCLAQGNFVIFGGSAGALIRMSTEGCPWVPMLEVPTENRAKD